MCLKFCQNSVGHHWPQHKGHMITIVHVGAVFTEYMC